MANRCRRVGGAQRGAHGVGARHGEHRPLRADHLAQQVGDLVGDLCDRAELDATLHLSSHGGVDEGRPVAAQHDADAHRQVHVLVAVDVPDVSAFGPGTDDRVLEIDRLGAG